MTIDLDKKTDDNTLTESDYDDPRYSYESFWQNRKYEFASETIAIRKLLADRHIKTMADIGGGYGRLAPVLFDYTDELILVEPSVRQRYLANAFVKKSEFKTVAGTAEDTTLPTEYLDAVVVIRVLHHLNEILPSFLEISRILKPNGFIILEFANSLNFKNRIRSWVEHKKISTKPMSLRSIPLSQYETLPFVNHHPQSVFHNLQLAGFQIQRKLSVSNFRGIILKEKLPLSLLTTCEQAIQPLLTSINFGPSIFVLAKKL